MDECKNFSIRYSRGELWALKPPFQKYAEYVFVPNHVKHQIVDYGIRRLLRPYRRSRAGLKLLQQIKEIASIVTNASIIPIRRTSITLPIKKCLVPLAPPLVKDKKYMDRIYFGFSKCKINLWKNR